MKPYVLSMLPKEDSELFYKIQLVVNDFPEVSFGKDEDGEELILSCHIFARAIGRVFNLPYVDGFFYPSYQHTWLLTSNKNIIDVYPVAVLGGPILMDGGYCAPAKWLYKKRRILCGKTKKPSFRRALRMTEKIVREIVAKQGLI